MQEAAEESGQGWPDSWWHAMANWSFMDFFVIVNGIGLLVFTYVYTKYHWWNRRIIPRRDAPTPSRWVKPRPKA